MYKRILVPLDGSKSGEKVIGTAIELAMIFEGTLTLIHVVELLGLLEKDRKDEYDVLKGQAEKYLAGIKKKIEDEGVRVDAMIKQGSPGVEICEYAALGGIDLIVMATRGWGAVERWVVGSVADKVVKHAPKPVLLLRASPMDILRGKSILAVDDVPDVLEVLEEQLEMCSIDKATSAETAVEYLRERKYDIAILDIMGVNGFDLLKQTVRRGIPTVMLTAHALTEEALRKSVQMGAVFYLPKDRLMEIEEVLAYVIEGGGKPVWKKLYSRFAPYFRKRFRWGPKEEEDFIKDLKQALRDG